MSQEKTLQVIYILSKVYGVLSFPGTSLTVPTLNDSFCSIACRRFRASTKFNKNECEIRSKFVPSWIVSQDYFGLLSESIEID